MQKTNLFFVFLPFLPPLSLLLENLRSGFLSVVERGSIFGSPSLPRVSLLRNQTDEMQLMKDEHTRTCAPGKQSWLLAAQRKQGGASGPEPGHVSGFLGLEAAFEGCSGLLPLRRT